MTPRRPALLPADPLARRGLLLAAPVLLMSGCGMLGGGADDPAAPDDGDESAADGASAEGGDAPSQSAVVDLSPVEVTEEAAAAELMTPLEGVTPLRHPYAEITVTASALLDQLDAEAFTALTGEEPPAAEDAEDGSLAATVLPGPQKQFLLAAWESTDPEWDFIEKAPSTALHVMVGGNEAILVDSARPGDAERSGIVLAVVDAGAEPAAATVRAETEDGAQQISLVDGSITETVAPLLYERELEVEVSDADSFETVVEDQWGSLDMSVRGTFEEAYLTPFVESSVELGGRLGWAGEDEVHLVVPLAWDMEYSANIMDFSEVVLTLSDGTELQPAQDRDTIFQTKHSGLTATFTIPAAESSATITVAPRYEQVLDEDFEQVEEPLSATLTFS